MRRRAMLVLLAMGTALLMAGGVAYALSVQCDGVGDQHPGPGQCQGTPNPDDILGTPNPEIIEAFAGNDVVGGFGGNDEIFGDEGNDLLDGYAGNDNIYGGPDGDGSADGKGFDFQNLEGGEESDTVYGGGGNDWIDAAISDTQGSVDSSFGGSGNDRIYAADGKVDKIDCGRGTRDRTFIDEGIDRGIDSNDIRGCEKIIPVVD